MTEDNMQCVAPLTVAGRSIGSEPSIKRKLSFVIERRLVKQKDHMRAC